MNQSKEEIEYELTYLAKCIPSEAMEISSFDMVDIYLPEQLDVHPRLRVRKQGKEYMITKKLPVSGEDASTHSENTIPLSIEEFRCLKKSSSRLVRKERKCIVIEGRRAEIDIFQGELEGLVLIDFEFSSKSEMEGFVPPDCCLADVTQENFIAGGLLAGKKYSDIEPDLMRLNYEKILR